MAEFSIHQHYDFSYQEESTNKGYVLTYSYGSNTKDKKKSLDEAARYPVIMAGVLDAIKENLSEFRLTQNFEEVRQNGQTAAIKIKVTDGNDIELVHKHVVKALNEVIELRIEDDKQQPPDMELFEGALLKLRTPVDKEERKDQFEKEHAQSGPEREAESAKAHSTQQPRFATHASRVSAPALPEITTRKLDKVQQQVTALVANYVEGDFAASKLSGEIMDGVIIPALRQREQEPPSRN